MAKFGLAWIIQTRRHTLQQTPWYPVSLSRCPFSCDIDITCIVPCIVITRLYVTVPRVASPRAAPSPRPPSRR